MEKFQMKQKGMDVRTDEPERVISEAQSFLSGPIEFWHGDQKWDRKIDRHMTLDIQIMLQF
jgi:hypothetical protein